MQSSSATAVDEAAAVGRGGADETDPSRRCSAVLNASHLVAHALGIGPRTAQRLARTLAFYGVLVLLGVVLAQLGADVRMKALGLGLMFPGGGFLAWIDWTNSAFALPCALALGSLALFTMALIVWVGTGNVLAPPLVWIGAAVMSALFGGDWDASGQGVYAGAMLSAWLAPGLAAMIAGGLGSALMRARRRRRARARSDALVTDEASRQANVVVAARSARTELSLDDLRRMRLVLDRALQPVERFEGFEWRDQFQTAAVRYQVNALSQAMSYAGFAFAPAFHGYMHAGQDNLARKMLDPRVWSYWRAEALWGHFSRDDDPIRRDNIMLSGFLATQLGLAHAATGQRWFDAPASLVFEDRTRGRTHAYSRPEIIASLVDQYRRAPLGLIACEPGFVYPLCNAITAAGIALHDAQRGREDWARLAPEFRHALQTEFTRADGRLVPLRSALIGFGAPALDGVLLEAYSCLYLNAVLPDVAARHWGIVRDKLRRDGIAWAIPPIDVGNYGFSRAAGLAACAAAAVEMGDGDIAARLLDALDEACPAKLAGGVVHRERASLWAHGVEMMARLGAAGRLAEMVSAGAARGDRPFIAAARYPDVLVARAVAGDGALDAVLHPGAAHGFHQITLAGLMPQRRYAVRGIIEAEFDADAAGRAHLVLPLAGRTEICVHPLA